MKTRPAEMNLERAATGPGGLFYGVYPAIVVGGYDSKQPGYLRIRLPMWGSEGPDNLLARIAVPMAGAGRGTFFMPDVNDEVLVAFEGGNPHRPYIVGALWNGQDTTPIPMNAENNLKAIVSRTGLRITLDDSPDAIRLRLETPDGRAIVLDDGAQVIDISDGAGNHVTMDSQGITIAAASALTVEASTVEVTGAYVHVASGLTKFEGVVECETLKSKVVISDAYTPGAGNIL